MRKMKKMMFEHAIQHVKNVKGKRLESKHGVLNAVVRVDRTDVVGIGVERSSISATQRSYS